MRLSTGLISDLHPSWSTKARSKTPSFHLHTLPDDSIETDETEDSPHSAGCLRPFYFFEPTAKQSQIRVFVVLLACLTSFSPDCHQAFCLNSFGTLSQLYFTVDGRSGTSSVIALVETSMKILSLTVEHSTQVKMAKHDIARFYLELKSLVEVLRSSHKLAQNSEATKFALSNHSRNPYNDMN